MYTDPSLAGLDDASFAAEADGRIEKLKAAVAEEAKNFYEQKVLPCEAERIRRGAKRRRDDGEELFDLLFVTVGGQPNAPALAVLATPARYVVLLHTDKTSGDAAQVIEGLGLDATRATLRSIGDGKRIPDLYRVCFEEWQNRDRPKRVAFDLTGGLKTMSAACASASFALPGSVAFYIDADQETVRPFWINERRITLDNPFVVFGEIRRQSARTLLASRAYPAAAVMYEEIVGQTGQPADDFRARLAKGYAVFDALNFEEAANILRSLANDLDARERDTPALRKDTVVAGRAHVRANSKGAHILADFVKVIGDGRDPARERDTLVTDACRDLIAMLLAAAERRRAADQHDVAALLAYRASEAIVQRRLALCGGTDPSAVDWQVIAARANLEVEELVRRYNDVTKKDYHLDVANLPARIGRAQAFGVLAVTFPNDVAEAKEVGKFAGLGEMRNRSLLAHGLARLNPDSVGKLLDNTENLFTRMLEIEKVAPADQSALRGRYRFFDVKGDWAKRSG